MKILLLDIETSYKLAAIWGIYEQNIGINQVLQDTHVLNWCAKWLGDKKYIQDSLHYHKKAYKKDPTNDKEILKSVWKLLDEADFVIAHNGAKFDGPVLNGRFLAHGMPPPSPYKMIDTLKIARRNFKLTSNKLNELGKLLGLGTKMDTGGMQLWIDVIANKSQKAFDKMNAYCKRDIELLEKVYLKLRSWDKTHPNLNAGKELDKYKCNACGSTKVVKDGNYITSFGIKQKFKCRNCNHSMSSLKYEKFNKDKQLRSI